MKEKRIKVVLTNHTFELRNVQVAEFMSEETTAFSTDIYVDGKKCGYCKNSGKGEGNYPMIDREYRELLAEIEKNVQSTLVTMYLTGRFIPFTITLISLSGLWWNPLGSKTRKPLNSKRYENDCSSHFRKT